MFKLGELLHISSSKNLILRAEVTPPVGALVLTKDAKEIGYVSDIFGPKSAPYVSVKPSVDNSLLRSIVGRVLFYEERRGMKEKRTSVGLKPIRGKRGG